MTTPLLTEAQVAERLGVARPTLRDWRHMDPPRGPAFLRLVGSIRYEADQLEAWIAAQRVETARPERRNLRGVERSAS